jgi:hypothetical protein
VIAALKADPSCRTILVEKTDRLYRNIKDWMTVDDLGVPITSSRKTPSSRKTRDRPARPSKASRR